MNNSLSNVQLHLVDSVDSAVQMMSWLGERRDTSIAVDIETTGVGNFNPREDKPRLVQLGDSHHGWAMGWEEWGGVFREAIDKYEGTFVGHNLPQYDSPILRIHAGINIPQGRSVDTRLMSHVIEPTYSTALKNLAARHVDQRAGTMGAHLASEMSERGWTWGTVPINFEPYWAYGALDTVLTARLESVMVDKVKAAGAWDAYELELHSAYIAQQMEDNGFAVDRPYAIEANDRFKGEASDLKERCHAEYGFTPTQNATVAQYLIADGLPLDKTTGSGAIALDKEVLGPYAGHPLVDLVTRHRRMSKLSSTYIRHFINKTSDENPILQFRINSVGARTGRWTMSDPSLHNLPRRDGSYPEAITVRNCLVPRSPDNVLMMIDFDQIEMRILTHLTKDPALMAAVMDPDVDIFTAMARMLHHDDTIEKKDFRRQTMKNAAYAINYGAGYEKFANTAGIPVSEGQEMYSLVGSTFPGIQQMSDMVRTVASQRLRETGTAFVKSPLTGRVHPAEDNKMYTLVNYLIQGVATEIMKMKLVQLDNAGFGPHMILTVHDEQIFDAPRDGIEEFTRTALDVMNDYDLLSVPITAAASLGVRWGEKEDYTP